MSAEELVEALKSAIESQLAFPVILLPQKAKNNTARIELLFQGIAENGEGNEKLTFLADFRTAGTHFGWLSKTISFSRKVDRLSNDFITVDVKGVKLRCYWKKNGTAGWQYPSEEEVSMPAEYVNPWLLEIDIPTRLFEEC